MSSRCYSVRLVSPREYDQLVLKSMMSIFGHRTQTDIEWIYQEEGSTDVIIVDYDVPHPTNIDSNHAIIIGYSEDELNLIELPFKLTRPLRARQLLSVLSDVENHLLGHSHLNKEDSPFTMPIDDIAPPSLSAYDAKLDWLYTCITQQKHRFFALQTTLGHLYIDKQRYLVYANYAFEQHRIEWLTSEPEPLLAIPLEAWHTTSLSELFYHLSLQNQPVRLLSTLTPYQHFQLKQWPAFANKPSLSKIAAYFAKHRSNLQTAAQELSIDMELLICFINAAHGQNLLAVDNVAGSAHIKETTAHTITVKSGLFERIRRKLGLS